MLKFCFILLLFAFASSIKLQHTLNWKSANNFSQSDRKFDEFFRDKIPALGDSIAKKVAYSGEFTIIQYLDETNNNDELVAWEVEGSEENGK